MQQEQEFFYRLTNWIKNPYVFLVWAGLAALSFFFLDQRVAWYMHTVPSQGLRDVANVVTDFGYGGPYIGLFLVLTLLGRFAIKNETLTQNSFFLLLAVVIPGIVCDIIKCIVGRSRPVQLFHHHLFGFYFFQTKASMWSFPSGHATTSTGVMIGLSYLFPKYWGLFALCFIAISYSRVVVTAHFISDIMMGMYLGAWGTIMIHDYLTNRGWLQTRFSQSLDLSIKRN